MMPSQQVMYSSQNYVKDRPLVSTTQASNTEDWTSRKRIETKTTTNVEKRIQRQVVLEDGRVIEEDVPQVTVDFMEDSQSHEDDGLDDVRHLGQDFAGVIPAERNMWNASGSVLSERDQRNTFTKTVASKSSTTASATNLGDISSKNVDKVIKYGKRTRDLVQQNGQQLDHEADHRVSIPAKVIHSAHSSSRTMDREDVKEVSRMQNGKVKNERYVTREFLREDQDQSPEEGSSADEAEVHDGDRSAFSRRTEERFVDYYSVPKGRSWKDASFLGHGIRMTSHDQSDQKTVQPQSDRALTYESEWKQDTRWPSRPPRAIDHAKPPGSSKSKHHRPRSQTPSGRHLVSTDSGHQTMSHTRTRPRRRSSSNYYVSDQSDDNSAPPAAPPSHHRSMTTLRSDLDDERASRLKRVMSFRQEGHRSPAAATPAPSKAPEGKSGGGGGGLLGSLKSLYASVASKKKTSHEKEQQPVRPPRKNQSKSISSLASDSLQSLDEARRSSGKRYNNESSSTLGRRGKWQVYPAPDAAIEAPYSTSSLPRPLSKRAQQHSLHRHQQQQHHHQVHRAHGVEKGHRAESSSPTVSVAHRRRRSASRSRPAEDSSSDNRDPPLFEPERQRERSSHSRYFGQVDDGEVDNRARPLPDMRRLLLHSVNLSRSKSLSKDFDTSAHHFITAA